MEKELVILTESYKNGGYCVAGIDIHTGKWIRLVSEDEDTDGALTLEDLTYYKYHRVCRIFDCVIVQILKKCDNSIQPENHMIDRAYHFERTGIYKLNDILKIHKEENYSSRVY